MPVTKIVGQPSKVPTLEAIAATIERIETRLSTPRVEDRDYLTRQQLCQLWDIDQSTLNRIESGKFGPPPPRYMVGGRPMYLRKEVDEWTRSRPAPAPRQDKKEQAA